MVDVFFYRPLFAAEFLFRVKNAIKRPVVIVHGDAKVASLLRDIETMAHTLRRMPSSIPIVCLTTARRDVFSCQSLGLKALKLGMVFGSHVKGVSSAPVRIMEREDGTPNYNNQNTIEIAFSIISICATIAVGIGVAKWQDTRSKSRDTQRHHEGSTPEVRDDTTPVPSVPGNIRRMNLASGTIPILPHIPPMSTVAFPEPVFRARATSTHKQRAMPARRLPVMGDGQIQQQPLS
ncbi:hypothetical protein PG993_007841 [Apiospora rasikravindrae]|uniref:Uncharacterized protein n=1 Tax=Apiospora rasikravindrae TaxID=990691 RepID=A0ABR1SYM5_9PEZI